MNKLLSLRGFLVLWLIMSCSTRSDRAAAFRDDADAALSDGRYAEAAASYQRAAEVAGLALSSRELLLRRAVQCLCYADCHAARSAIDQYFSVCPAGTLLGHEFEILVVASNARCEMVKSACLLRLETVFAETGRPRLFSREALERSIRPFEVIDANLTACLDRLDEIRREAPIISLQHSE